MSLTLPPPASPPDVSILFDLPLSSSSPSVSLAVPFLMCIVLPCLGFRVRPVLPHKSERLVSLLLRALNFLALPLPLFLSPVPEIVH